MAAEHVCGCLARLRTDGRDWLLAETAPDGALVRRVAGEDLVDRVYALARALRRAAPRAAVCAVYAAGCIDWAVAALAAAAAGMAVAPLNARMSGPELRRAVAVLSGDGRQPLRLLVADDARLARWRESGERLPELAVRIGGGGGTGAPAGPGVFPSAEALVRHAGVERPAARENAHATTGDAFIIFTSGTTGGTPKAAVLSHAALNAQSRAKAEYAGYTSSDVYLNTAPLHHVGGLSSMLAYLAAGGRQLFMAGPGAERFDAGAVLRCCRAHRVTSIIAVPTMIFDMDAVPRGAGAGGPEVAKVLIGGGGLSRRLLRSVRRMFPTARVVTAYGMTEAASSITFADAEDWELQQRSGAEGNYVGRAAAHFGVRIAPADAPSGAGPGPREGEIEIRGVSVMSRYLHEERAAGAGGRDWFATGDIGVVLEDGRVFLRGRKKDVIRVGSENVHASEVEGVLLDAEGVGAAAVVGLPDERLGEVVAAMVALADGWAWADRSASGGRVLSRAALQAHCRAAGLAGFKVPRHVSPAPGNALPRTALGKVIKNEVRGALLGAIGVQRPRL